MSKSFEDRLLELSIRTFDEKNVNLDDDTLHRLRQARKEAIASSETKPDDSVITFPTWLSSASTATAFASISLIAITLLLQPELSQVVTSTPLDDIALLSSAESLEFYENLDFYIWLDTQDNAT